ncbi:MAG: NTP transferase domain-containing protein, partial [Chitinophagaceae bacterium]|nr:NTP transferase domain-containing protein [Chitinophagaceae bacterium]
MQRREKAWVIPIQKLIISNIYPTKTRSTHKKLIKELCDLFGFVQLIMLGVILCGGKSSRMGSDKGLLKLEAKTWAQTAVDKLTALEMPIVLSVNENQLRDYTAVFNSNELICDDPSLSIHGP